MTSARKVLVADRCSQASTCPIGVYGPTRNTSSSPMTSGGSSRLHSTPVSHTRGNGSFPRASIQASGVQNTNSTPRVTSPDSTEVDQRIQRTRGRQRTRDGAARQVREQGDHRTEQASQITPAPATDTHADTERSLSGAPVNPPTRLRA